MSRAGIYCFFSFLDHGKCFMALLLWNFSFFSLDSTVEISLLGLSFYFFDSSFSSETVNCSCNKKECRCVCLQCCVYVTVFKHSPPTKITDSNLVPDSFIKMPIRYWVMIHSHHYFWLEVYYMQRWTYESMFEFI